VRRFYVCSRLISLGWLFFLAAVEVSCQEGPLRAVRSGPWNDSATWGGLKPRSTDEVVIENGLTVDYDLAFDQNPAAEVKQVTIQGGGTLRFLPDTRMDLDGSLLVLDNGTLEVGTSQNPIPATKQVLIGFNVFNDRLSSTNDPNWPNFRPGPNPTMPDFHPEDIGLWTMGPGSRATFHGAVIPRTWLRLIEDAPAGTTQLRLEAIPTGWQVGNQIVLAPSGTNPDEAEIRTITAISNDRLTLDRPLSFLHHGRKYAFHSTNQTVRALLPTEQPNADEKLIALQAEIGNLTRNVKIVSNLVKEGDPNHRAHSLYMHGASGSMAYTELLNLGGRQLLGRYPMHFHLLGTGSAGFKLTGLSIWSSISDPINKFIAIHGSSHVEVRDVVGFNCQGRGFYQEDGREVGNILERNLGIRCHAPEELPGKLANGQPQGDEAAIFWVREGNTLRDNAAAGGIGSIPTSGAEGANLARSATATASSGDTTYGQIAAKAIDGCIDGFPGNHECEWATNGDRTNAWLELRWPSAVSLNRVVLYDRRPSQEHVTSGRLRFSDGSTVTVGALNNEGSATTFTFSPRSTTSLRFEVTGVSSSSNDIGLQELEAFGDSDGSGSGQMAGFWITPSQATGSIPSTVMERNVSHSNRGMSVAYASTAQDAMTRTNFTLGQLWRNDVAIGAQTATVQATTSQSIFLGNGDHAWSDAAYASVQRGQFANNLYFDDTTPPVQTPPPSPQCQEGVCTPECPQYCGGGGGPNCNGVCEINADGSSDDGIFCPSDCGGGGGWESSCGNSSCDAGDSWVCPQECSGITGRAEVVASYITWRPNPDPTGRFCNPSGRCWQNIRYFVNGAYQNVGDRTSGTACASFEYSRDGQNWIDRHGWDKDRLDGIDGGYGIEHVAPGGLWGRGIDTNYSRANGGLPQLSLSEGGWFIRILADVCSDPQPGHDHPNGTTSGDNRSNNVLTVFVP